MVKPYKEINECVALINHNKDQLYLLEGINIKDPVERAFIDNLHAYELALFKKMDAPQSGNIPETGLGKSWNKKRLLKMQ